MWKKCLDCIDELLDILFEHNNIFIGENIAEDSENLANTDQVPRLLFVQHLGSICRICHKPCLPTPLKSKPPQNTIYSSFHCKIITLFCVFISHSGSVGAS